VVRLIVRDALAARRLTALLVVFYVLYLAMAARAVEAFLLTTMTFSLGFALGGLALDARRGSEALWASLPLDRASIVRARYLAALLFPAAALAMSWAVGRLAAAVLPGGAERLPACVYAALLGLIALVAAAYLPFHFKLGPSPGLTAFSAVWAGSLAVTAVISQLVAWLLGSPGVLLSAVTWRTVGRIAVGHADAPPDLPVAMLMTAALLVIAALYLLSMRVSEQFYRERDL
jgi:hypothetical protein